MLPAPTPMKNHPVMRPVMFRRRPANVIVLGNRDAIERPVPMVPAHNAGVESDHNRRMPTLTSAPTKLTNKIVRGLMRVVKGMPINRPAVIEPQKAEARYAAVVALARFSETVYV